MAGNLGASMSEGLRSVISTLKETRFAGLMDEWHCSDINGNRGIRGPNNSYGIVTHEDGVTAFDYHAPEPMRMGPHWHSFTEQIEVIEGEVIVTLTGQEPRLLREGDSVHIDPFVPHRADVEVSSRYIVTFGPGCVCVEAGHDDA